MPVHVSLLNLLRDPPPAWAFELSPAGLAAAEIAGGPRLTFTELPPDTLSLSPQRDNVLRPDSILEGVRTLTDGGGSRKRRRSALIVPDYAVRVTVLDFDDFPSDAKEQASLVRFRLKRSVPFDVDSAALSFYTQKAAGTGPKVHVTAAIAPLEIVARYEAPFRLAGFHTGWVTTSTLAALELMPAEGLKLLVKRAGRVLSLAVVDRGTLNLIRTIELTDFTPQEIAGHLFQTLAYVEDQLSSAPDMMLLCGFDATAGELRGWLKSELGVPAEFLRSRFGVPGEANAGLLGYLEGLGEQ